jgi:hypothetical protein
VAHLQRQGLAGAEIGRRLALARRDAMQAALRDANLIT